MIKRQTNSASRFYTEPSHQLMMKFRMGIIILTSPLWIPLWLLTWMGIFAEEVIDKGDDVIMWILDRTIPQIKNK